MKRLVSIVCLVLVAGALHAQTNDERDVLLTPAGTLYSIESQPVPSDADLRRQLTLTVQNGADKRVTIVPSSLTAGFRCAPALAYDADADTLFVFWLRMPNIMSSELLLASYHNGAWTAPISVDNQAFRLRSNLRIAVQRQVADASNTDIPALIVHAVWWEQSGGGEAARYALVAMEKGAVSNIDLHNLSDLANTAAPMAVEPNFNSEILRHPAIFDNGTKDSVDVLFGDTRTNTFTRTTLKPIAQVRIHIPIGHGGGDTRIIAAPGMFAAPWNGRISTISSSDKKLLLYSATADAVNYIVYDNGAWTGVRSVPVSDKLSSDGAVSVLHRMMSASQ